MEWHAHIGVAGDAFGEGRSGNVDVSMREKEGGAWKVYDCGVGDGRIVSVFMMLYMDDGTRVLGLKEGIREAGMDLKEVCACYLDVSGSWEIGGAVGMVPCRSIWDEEGRRMVGVVILDRVST